MARRSGPSRGPGTVQRPVFTGGTGLDTDGVPLPRESPPEALVRARLRRLADRLNDTPRRCFGYRTPREVFDQHLAAPPGPS